MTRPSTDELLGAWEPEPDGRCQSLDGYDLRCELPENHGGDHRHLLTWENPPPSGPTRAGDEAFEAAYRRMVGRDNLRAINDEIARGPIR